MFWSIDHSSSEREHIDKIMFSKNSQRSVIVTDEHERIVGVSHSWVQMCGFDPEEAFGSTPRILQGLKTDKSAARLFVSDIRNGNFAKTVLINYKKTREMFRHEIVGWQFGDLLIVETICQDKI